MTFNGAQFRHMRAVLFFLCIVFGISSASLAADPKISAGWYHTIALKYDGTVWAWGSNGNGELGNGTTTSSNVPVQVSGLSNITSISGGKQYSAALTSDGTVWTWGDNSNGQLGIGEEDSGKNTPVQVDSISNITAISAGRWHTVALQSDGTVWAWGQNYSGILGNGTETPSNSPVQATGFTGTATAVVAGGWFTLALKSDGTVWSVGNNLYGSLGNGTTTSSVTPVQVSGLSDDSGTVTAIACGDLHSIALKSDGTVWAWGYNGDGQLGNGESGTATSRNTPVQVSSLTDVTAIACGLEQSIALKSDGTVLAWGNNEYGVLGNGNSTDSAVPVQVSGLSGVTAIAGGRWHTGALKSDGTVHSSGWNQYGQLGNGTNTTSNTPVQASDINLNETQTTTTTTTTTTTSTTTTTQSGGGGGGGGGGGTTTPTPGVTPTPEATPTPDITPAPSITPLPTLPPLPTPPPIPLPSPTVTLIATPTPAGECVPDSMELSKKKIRLKVKKSAKVTVALTGADGCPAEGEEVTARVNKTGKKLISIPDSEFTDENGEAMFTINAKKKYGKAKVTFEAGGLTRKLTVEVRKSKK